MGIQYCLDSLKHSLRQLKALDKGARRSHRVSIERTVNEMAGHALIVVFPMVQKLDALYRGQPLKFNLVDNYSAAVQDNPTRLYALFNKRMLGPSGLRHHLRRANDRELFDTYRAIGCTTFTDFEILVHRAVTGLEVEIKDLETMLATEIEGMAEQDWDSERRAVERGEDGGDDETENVKMNDDGEREVDCEVEMDLVQTV
ncbi:hypothetical protein A1O3_07140 [Capronia epimyces CBS 606.96]|uniref:Uncharacterized protein n=1 Tax=Capronia epimyces CBS 606.96 TaxID=1182542 RepID=W9YF02_9EURO|nr:uncharacterized protein A1O3_07140 [Capronia epimyces CBS 606.96]EXJ80854.1 hypothetical protein A1O3_07140 [Capronia epimyces CBS 606.96]